ncbi:hypothetical protein [Halalkalicoccus salilacus]|uniref:hypothetical protein n=1 Tax=Halalkalicoccus sp. GCM10025704 TaxID=3252662 RepID=UPI00360C398B
MADDHHDGESAAADHEHGRSHGYADAGSHALLGGLTVSANGLRIEASDTRIDSDAELSGRTRYATRTGPSSPSSRRPTTSSLT